MYIFVTKNGNFHGLNFKFGTSLISAVLKKWACRKWSRGRVVHNPPHLLLGMGDCLGASKPPRCVTRPIQSRSLRGTVMNEYRRPPTVCWCSAAGQ